MNKPRIKGKYIYTDFGKEIKWTHNYVRWFYSPWLSVDCAIQDQSIIVGARYAMD